MFCLCSHTLHARTLCAYDFTKVAIFRNKNNFLQKKNRNPSRNCDHFCRKRTLFYHFERLFFVADKACEIERSRATRLRFSRLGQVEIAVAQSAKSARSELVAPATDFRVVRILRTALCKRHNRPFSLIIDTSQLLVFCPLCAIHTVERIVGKLRLFARIASQNQRLESLSYSRF